MTADIQFSVDMRNEATQKRVVLIGNMIRLASTIERGATWSISPVTVAKREGWTIKSATKERALLDMVELAQQSFGYKVERGTTLAKAIGMAKAKKVQAKATRKAKALV